MQLSSETISVLKNFSTINPSLWIKRGDTISTISPQKTIIAKAKVQESFPVECGLYELNKFLSVISLFNSQTTNLDFQDKFVDIIDGSQKIRYVYADKEMIAVPPEREIVFPTPDCSFKLTSANLQSITKAISVLQLPEVAFVADEGIIEVKGINSKSPTADNYSLRIGETNKQFKMVYKVENLKFISNDYIVDITKDCITRFSAENISYMIMAEATSNFK